MLGLAGVGWKREIWGDASPRFWQKPHGTGKWKCVEPSLRWRCSVKNQIGNEKYGDWVCGHTAGTGAKGRERLEQHVERRG